jgi:hypothetical protein
VGTAFAQNGEAGGSLNVEDAEAQSGERLLDPRQRRRLARAIAKSPLVEELHQAGEAPQAPAHRARGQVGSKGKASCSVAILPHKKGDFLSF